MKYYENRIRTIITELEEAELVQKIPIEQFLYRPCGYEMNTVIWEDKKAWKPFLSGDTWGREDGHGCFYTDIVIPEEYHGEHVVVQVSTNLNSGWNVDNPQFMVYLDKELHGALDVNHMEFDIAMEAQAGRAHELILYAYNNHGDNNISLAVNMYIVKDEVRKLRYDLLVPFESTAFLSEQDLVKNETLKILNDTLNQLDLRLVGGDVFYRSVREADAFLEDNYYKAMCKENQVVEHCIGHTHIDVAWRWTLAQTREKAVRSFSTVLALMKRYPEYKFMSSQPQLYQYVKEDNPVLYEKIKEKVAEGRWEVEGAMWLEADCNLTSGESLVRQILYGKRFFKREFNKDNKILWLPDVFGYSASLPQIMKKSGIQYFMTTKISWNEINKIPNDTMYWRGIDGTEVLTYFITTQDYKLTEEQEKDFRTTYNGILNSSQVAGGWQRYQNKDINQEILNCYGHGDGGGGVTADMLEQGRRLSRGIPGMPVVKQTFAGEFFEHLEERLKAQANVPKWVGELYLEFHRGTYTSMARNKRYNRKCEFLNSDAEFFAQLNGIVKTDYVYPEEELREMWEITLLNQFHDILPGSSIFEVYEDSKRQYEEIIKRGEVLTEEALTVLTSRIPLEEDGVIVFNTLGFDRNDTVVIEGLGSRQEGVSVWDKEEALKSQITYDGNLIVKTKGIPSKGYKSFSLRNKGDKNHASRITVTSTEIETPFYSIKVSKKGYFASIFDKEEQRELIKAGAEANVFQVFEDRPSKYDAWNLDEYFVEKMWVVDELLEWKVVEEGPVRTCIYTKRRFLDSVLEQIIILYPDSKRIDFSNTIDWKQSQLFLKAAFPLDIRTDKAVFEIQYGNVERNTHRNTSWDEAKFEVCAQKWVDLSENGYGVALLNDCKYGYDILDSVMRLSLIKSPIEPNPVADQEVHTFTYSIYPHKGDFRTGEVIHRAYELNCPMYAKLSPAKQGDLSNCFSLLRVSDRNIFVETIKKAEDSTATIIRLYEAYGRRTQTELILEGTTVASAWECNLLEQPEQALVVKDNTIAFTIKPYEIKTFIIET